MIIQKSDKGNSIVLINKADHLDKMYNILSDSEKFVKSSVVDDRHLNFLIGIEKKLNDLLKELKASEAISKIDYKKRKPRSSSFGVLYGLCKTHEKVLDKCPLFGTILKTIKTPCYNFVKFFFSPHWTHHKKYLAIKNSFEFSKEICEQNPGYFMASFDVESLSTHIALEETIKICCDSLYKNQLLCNISKNQF